MYSSSINNLEPFKSHTGTNYLTLNCYLHNKLTLLYTIQLISSSYIYYMNCRVRD